MMKHTLHEIVLLSYAGLVGIIILGLSIHAAAGYDPVPVTSNHVEVDPTETFIIELSHTYGHDCRYNIYVKTKEKKQRVGYIKHHCDYVPDTDYLLTIAE